MANATPRVFESFSSLPDLVRNLAKSINRLLDGHGNNIITSVTLTANAATTTVTDNRIERDTILHLMPTTANAATEFGAGTLRQTYPNSQPGVAVLTHANNAQTDRVFAVTLSG